MRRGNRQHADQRSAPGFFSPDVTEARRFYLKLNPPPMVPLAVVCGGWERCTPTYAIQRATFPFHSIEYVLRGRGTLGLDGRMHTLEPGRLFAYGPGVRQEIRSDPAAPLVKYFVDFAGRRAASLLRVARLAPGRVSQVFPPHDLQGLFDELIECGLRGSKRSADLCAGLLECLVLKIADQRAPVAGAETLAFTTYHRCRQHMQQHFRRLRTLEQIGEECGVNDAYLCRLFRRYAHQSPYQHLLRLKMNYAAGRLRGPGALVKQVAEEVGFTDPGHFSRAFKAVFSLAPGGFRRLR